MEELPGTEIGLPFCSVLVDGSSELLSATSLVLEAALSSSISQGQFATLEKRKFSYKLRKYKLC